MRRNSSQTVNIANLSLRSLYPTSIRVAPLPEQKRIIAEIEKQFTRLDQAVTSLKRAQAKLARYKASVLKAACEGRLVPQDPNDEPAAKLLARILAERRQRWQEGEWQKLTIKAQKKAAQARRKAASRPARLSDLPPEEWQELGAAEYAHYLPKNDKWKERYKEPVGVETAELPPLTEGWTRASLEQLSWNASYGTSQKCDYNAVGPPVLRIPNISSAQIKLDDLKFAIDDSKLGNESNAIAPGDILIIRTNGSRNLIGRAAVVKQELEHHHYYASYLIRFRLFSNPDVSTWLGAIWDSQYIREWIETTAATSAGQYNISLSALNTLSVPLPPLFEQKRIVDEVERRLSIIATNEKAITTNLARAEHLRQSILQQAFSGRLVRPQRSSSTSEVWTGPTDEPPGAHPCPPPTN